ncbi:MAG: methylated-DNA--[protein]-cysteine S-methyltransferase [Pseudolabrys sp.]|nr:methylated-DNA--[protein]-cysteine S-methyltransferase [Pseudolabrys sp.]
MTLGLTIFDTAIGPCGIAWGPKGIVGVQFPQSDANRTRALLMKRCPGATEAQPPQDIVSAIEDIVALLSGEVRDLAHIDVDIADMPDFNRRVYAVARTIPPGKTMTYGEVVQQLGDPLLARDVGQALGQNRIPIIIPCHRVLTANGKSGGFSAPGGVATKMRLLSSEGAQPQGPDLFGDLPLAVRKSSR